MEVQEGSGRRRAVGTALVIGDGLSRIVTTAHHVVSGPTSKAFGVTGQESVPWPRKYWKLGAKVASVPDPDVAWAVATVTPEDEALAAKIPLALARPGRVEVTESSTLLVLGYPASKAKSRDAHTVMSTKLMSAVVSLAGADACSKLGLDDRVQYGLLYDRTSRTFPHDQRAHPQGMSGGALFLILQGAPPGREPVYVPMLIGILTEFHEDDDLLVATKVEYLLHGVGVQVMADPLHERVDA
jgi:hypothetical protein